MATLFCVCRFTPRCFHSASAAHAAPVSRPFILTLFDYFSIVLLVIECVFVSTLNKGIGASHFSGARLVLKTFIFDNLPKKKVQL